MHLILLDDYARGGDCDVFHRSNSYPIQEGAFIPVRLELLTSFSTKVFLMSGIQSEKQMIHFGKIHWDIFVEVLVFKLYQIPKTKFDVVPHVFNFLNIKLLNEVENTKEKMMPEKFWRRIFVCGKFFVGIWIRWYKIKIQVMPMIIYVVPWREV